jgi:hypothetical protein
VPAVLSAKASAAAETMAKVGDLTVVRVFTGWRDEASFKRISEYFTGRENTGGEAMIRTHPDQRAGYYFLVRTSNPSAPLAAKITLQLILPSNTKLQNYTFPVELKTGDTVLNLGLTGDDWPNAHANPVAWKLDFVAADGHVLASEKSYLWEKPTDK